MEIVFLSIVFRDYINIFELVINEPSRLKQILQTVVMESTMKHQYNWFFLVRICLVAAMGGLLFGYDWVVIGGAKPFYESYFRIGNDASMQGWAMSCALVGCIIGVVMSGGLSDKYGRKKLLLLSAAIFIIASIGTGAANTLNLFVFFRIFGGIGIGLASNLSPMYIAEIAPAKVRGSFVSINQITIVVGILAAQIINLLIAEPVPINFSTSEMINSWNVQTGWRMMFYVCAIPAGIFFVLMWLVPESPRWLAKKSQNNHKVKAILNKIGGHSFEEQEMRAMSLDQTKDSNFDFKLAFKGKTSKVLIVGIVLAVFQQWCGINVIFNYAQEIFSQAGYGVSDILFNIVLTGVVNVVFSLVGMFTVDRLGRKPLMLIGAGGLACIYGCIGTLYYFQIEGWPLLVLVILGIACFAMTLAPVTWVLLSEIFPTRIRAVAMSISTFALWIACFILTYTFPLLNKSLGASGTFWLYGVLCVLGGVFIYINLSETKGQSLEQIEKRLNDL
ncbi:MAG TPA: sugar porter family MFS transporter [Cytophagaceae bacterium]|jgi:SP family sugar porter-like MFS transporter